jgi:hypothetical protein
MLYLRSRSVFGEASPLSQSSSSANASYAVSMRLNRFLAGSLSAAAAISAQLCAFAR